MKKFLLAPVLTALLGLGFTLARAQETPVQATVIAVTGSASVRLADGASVPATAGQTLTQGAVIVTGPGARLSLRAHEGIVAVIAANSRVELEKLSVSPGGTRHTLLYLTTGHVASSLDPAHKRVNNYGVRTERGLALAHGTTMTVSVSGKIYTVSVVAGTVTVNWAGGNTVSITGNTPACVTTSAGGEISTVSLGAALAAAAVSGRAEALTAAAAAVATVATGTGQVTAVIDTIAAAAGHTPTAAALVAGVSAAATGAAVTNSTLVTAAGAGGATSVAATIGTAAVASATAAGNGVAAELILVSTGNAVVKALPDVKLNAVAKAITEASNSLPGNPPVKAGEVISGVNAPRNAGTPITPVDPSVLVVISPSA